MRSFHLSFSGSTGRGQSIRGSVISLLITILLSRSMVLVTPEIIDLGMDMIIDASSEEVHFIRGFLRAPASIDLSNIRWITNEAIVFEFGDDAALIDDFYGDYSYETSTSEPTFFGSEIGTSVEEPFGDGDIPAGEEAIEEDDDSQGDVAEEDNFGEDTEQEEDTVDEGADDASTEEEEEEEEHDNDEAPDDKIPSIDENGEDEDTQEEDGEGADEDEVNENQADSEPDEDEGDESETEGDENNTEDLTPDTQSDEDDNNDVNNESNGDVGEGADEDEVNENQADSKPDEDEGKESETEGDENNTEEVTPDTQSDEDDNNDVNDESDEDVGDNGNEQKSDEEDGETETEGEENNAEEPTTDTQSNEDDNKANDETDGDVGDNENEQKSDEEDEETDNEGEENNAEEPTTDTQSNEDDNKANDETDGDVGDNGNENNDGEGEEETETETVEEDIDEEDPLPEQTDVEENDGNEGEDVDVEKGDNEDDQDGGELPSTDGQDGDQPVPEDADAEESTSSPEGDRNLQDFNQILDIALFAIPENCEKDNWGNCDWVKLGVGAKDDEMQQGMSYCCSTDTAFRKVCDDNDIGTLMIDENKFDGFHRKMQVPSKPLEEFYMDDPVFDVKESGDYVLVIANCNDDGFGIITLGDIEWKSVGGYLPGTIFYSMFVYGASTAIFFVLGLWYHCGMRMFQEAAIPIQKYILSSIILGFLGTAFLAIDLLFWNITGTRSPVVMYIAFAIQIVFQGLLRCLGVMVAMGWGVVRDTLGMALCKIILLGLLYSGLSLLRYSLEAAASSAHLVSSTEKEELIDLALILEYVIVVINVIFYCWIISSVKSTTEYLRNMNQTSKLRRHLRLRCLIIISLIIISSLAVINIFQALASKIPQVDDIKIFKHENEWIIEAVKYGNYLFIVFGVTILWRPNADAKDYAMQMQIATEEDENDLELSCVVPSADDVDIGEGYKVDDAVIT